MAPQEGLSSGSKCILLKNFLRAAQNYITSRVRSAGLLLAPLLYTVGRTPWTVDQPVASLLLTHRSIQTE
jgi:hypothetical protein